MNASDKYLVFTMHSTNQQQVMEYNNQGIKGCIS